MPTTYLRVDRDDARGSAPPGTIEIRDPRPAPQIENAAPGSYEIMLDEIVIGALADFQALRVEVTPGRHVVATRALGTETMICALRVTLEADASDDVGMLFRCHSNGILDGPLQVNSRSAVTRRGET